MVALQVSQGWETSDKGAPMLLVLSETVAPWWGEGNCAKRRCACVPFFLQPWLSRTHRCVCCGRAAGGVPE
eukprot:4345206-Alexandrium_andersonii.AAC.1